MAGLYPPHVYTTQNTTSTILNSYAGSFTINTGGAGNSSITVPNGGSSVTMPYTYSTGVSNSQASLNVTGEANFDGDVKIKGRSIVKMIEGIEKRLAILQPDPKKLEKFEALQKAYAHYKLLEALLHEEDKDGS
jgi:hypothetical protein